MPLPKAKLDRVLSHLKGKIRSGCPLCGSTDWTVDENLQFMGVLDPEYKQPVQGSITPLVMVSCNNCLFSFHLPALKLGLLD